MAEWILTSQKQKVAKALVVVWVVGQSLATPLWTLWKDRVQSERDGLNETPRFTMGIVDSGACVFRNDTPRPLVMVQVREYLHAMSPTTGCIETGGYDSIVPLSKTPDLEPGAAITALPDPAEFAAMVDACQKDRVCLIECEVVFHRAADLARFERVDYSGIIGGAEVVTPIFDVDWIEKPKGVTELSFGIAERWGKAYECALEKRDIRIQSNTLLDSFRAGSRVVQPKK